MAAMVLVVVTLLVGLVVGYATGGRVSNFNLVRLHHGWLLALAVVAQVAIAVVGLVGGPVGPVAFPLLLGSHLALFAFIWLNRRLPGMAMIFLGFLMNAVVIGANGAMPVSGSALERIAGEAVEEIDPGKHRVLEEDDHLPFLADVIPVPPLRTVASVGDLVLAVGVCIFVVSLMRGRGLPRRRVEPPSELAGEEPHPGSAAGG